MKVTSIQGPPSLGLLWHFTIMCAPETTDIIYSVCGRDCPCWSVVSIAFPPLPLVTPRLETSDSDRRADTARISKCFKRASAPSSPSPSRALVNPHQQINLLLPGIWHQPLDPHCTVQGVVYTRQEADQTVPTP